MRHRITFVHSLEGTEKSISTLNSTYLELVEHSNPAREDRFTYLIDKYSHIKTLRVQINKAQKPKNTTNAFSYNYQYGLHIYAVPQDVPGENERETFFEQISELLQDLFGIQPKDDAWITSLNSLYYHTSDLLEPKKAAFEREINSKWTAFEYYYDQGAVTLKTFDPELERLAINAEESQDYTEVGVFGVDQHTTRDDIILHGVRVVLNDVEADDSEGFVHRTMFHVKPRHRILEPVDIDLKPNGLHPVVTIALAPTFPKDDDISRCKLFYYMTLGKSVFVDPYQIPALAISLVNYGTKNLELPEYSVSGWGNEILMEIADDASFPLDLTLHSRYQLPNKLSGTEVTIDRPILFYGCEAGSDDFLLNNSPFDNKKAVGGNYEKFFTDDTIFYHALERGALNVTIPNALGDSDLVNFLTFLALFAGVAIVLSKLFRRPVSNKKKSE